MKLSAAAVHEKVYVRILDIDGKTGEVVYEQRLQQANQAYAAAILADGKLYYVCRNGRTFVVAARPKFEQLAVNDLGERGSVFNTPPVVSDGRMYLRSNQFLYCLAMK